MFVAKMARHQLAILELLGLGTQSILAASQPTNNASFLKAPSHFLSSFSSSLNPRKSHFNKETYQLLNTLRPSLCQRYHVCNNGLTFFLIKDYAHVKTDS